MLNPKCLLLEDLVTFLHCDSGTTGEALADQILGFITSHLDPSKMRGQAYDGASNMSGGTAARISSVYPLALCINTAFHSLNLGSCGFIPRSECAQYMIGVVDRLSSFAHPKRQKKLEEPIHNTQPKPNVTKLKDLCRTRWIERIDALDRVKCLRSSIVVCFESISAKGSHKWSPDSLTDASTLLLAITTTEFISALVITNGCLHYFLGLNRHLRQEVKDIVQAVPEVEVLTWHASYKLLCCLQ